MAKKLSILFAILFIGLAVSARTNMRDVVYLKNDGKVKGFIVEQFPGVSLNTLTADGIQDGSIKMAKETIEETTTNNFNQIYPNYLPSRKFPIAAGILSFCFPGTGELYATNWKKGWGMLCIGLGTTCASALVPIYIESDVWITLSSALSIIMLATRVYSVIKAVGLAKETNIENGYFSFKVGERSYLGVRPEFSYNNMMMPNGGFSPQFTSGIGFSLSF